VYRVKDAVLSAVKASPGLTDVHIPEVPDDEIPRDLVTRRSLEELPWEGTAVVRWRCGAVAILRETVCWRSPEGPARRVYAWCTSCYPVEHGEEEPTPRAPQYSTAGKLDGWTIVQDWQEEKQFHEYTGGTDC
jgi:hypothetical protein